MIEFNTLSDENVFVNVDHKNLTTPLIGFATRGVSTTGTEGMIIFIPTGKFKDLSDLIKVVK